MRRIILNTICALLCSIVSYSQNSDNVTNYSYENKDQLQVHKIIPISELSQLERLDPNCFLPTVILPFSNENTHFYWIPKEKFRLKHFYLSTFNARMINWGITDINNVGMGGLWQSSSKVSVEWSAFISKQYGYTLNSVHLSPGLKMNFNYRFNNKLKLSLWGQYLLNRSTDPFTRADNNQSQNGVGLRLEYNPNLNTTYSIDISKQKKNISPQNSFIQVEGKAGFKF